MYTLSSPAFTDCITWTHDGKAFFFLNYDKFAQKYNNICRGRTGTIRYATFRRRLNRWGFRMNLQQGPTRGAFSHELFRRDDPELCGNIVYSEASQPICQESRTNDDIHESYEHTNNLTNEQSLSRDIAMNVENIAHLSRMIAIEELTLHAEISIYKRLQELHRPIHYNTEQLTSYELGIYGATSPFGLQEHNTRAVLDNEYLFAWTHSHLPFIR